MSVNGTDPAPVVRARRIFLAQGSIVIKAVGFGAIVGTRSRLTAWASTYACGSRRKFASGSETVNHAQLEGNIL